MVYSSPRTLTPVESGRSPVAMAMTDWTVSDEVMSAISAAA